MKNRPKNHNLKILEGKILISLPMILGAIIWLPAIFFGLKIAVAKASVLSRKPVAIEQKADNFASIQGNSIMAISSYDTPVKPLKCVQMMITAYSSTIDQTDSTPFITASGSSVKDGIVANNFFPFGTKIRLPDIYGDKVFTVEDRMNSRMSNYHIDVWLANTKEAKNFGAKIATVEVIE